ncbi:MAG: F0F1 ATP synthase subunit gamma [Chromatiales bacterium]|nr:F0F1 ATP synthase subunit gamma [Chromatiales bacterium]
MAIGKEIRTKINSVKNTQKITKAMEMVAASKMRRAQDKMAASRPYADRMRSLLGHIAQARTEYKHPFLVTRDEVKSIGYIIVSTDRGLCGGLNVNLFKAALASMKEWKSKNVDIKVTTIGSKGAGFFKRYTKIISKTSHLGDSPQLAKLLGTMKVIFDAYQDQEIDRVFLVENRFVNTMTQSPQVLQLLPVPPLDDQQLGLDWDYIYEPDSHKVLDFILKRYIESQVYQAAVENVACEMAARMVAMKSASENAGSLIDELQLAYNKARQAAITQELSEIVGGAAAI